MDDEILYNVMQYSTDVTRRGREREKEKEYDLVENSTSSKGKEDVGERKYYKRLLSISSRLSRAAS